MVINLNYCEHIFFIKIIQLIKLVKKNVQYF